MLEKPGGPPRVVRTWSGVEVLIDVSPDLRRILVGIGTLTGERDAAGFILSGGFQYREEWVYEVAGDRWLPVARWERRGGAFRQWGNESFDFSQYRRGWAGPRTLARMGPGLLAFEEIDSPGSIRYVFGG